MSGYPGLNQWEEFYRAHREHIERFTEQFNPESRRVRRLSNKALAKEIYAGILEGDHNELVLAEAAERLGIVTETATMKQARNN